MTGTYYLHQYTQSLPARPLRTAFHTTIDNRDTLSVGVSTTPRLRYRTRLGWSNGAWSVTGFADYQATSSTVQTAPPNVNNHCTAAGGVQPGGSLPCLVTGYSNIEPSWLTFDLSIGYDTGDDPRTIT
jgi:hypothetical protein